MAREGAREFTVVRYSETRGYSPDRLTMCNLHGDYVGNGSSLFELRTATQPAQWMTVCRACVVRLASLVAGLDGDGPPPGSRPAAAGDGTAERCDGRSGEGPSGS